MEDNHILLMRVLKIHYKDRQHVLDEALTVIKEYSNKQESTQSEYDEITATLKGMLNDLPENILKYFLTMVPLPKRKENLALNYHDAYDIRSILTEYLNQGIPPLIPIAKSQDSRAKTKLKIASKSKKRPVSRSKKRAKECKKLLDICAEYIVQNHSALNQEYQNTKEDMWKLVNGNKCDTDELEKIYDIIRDLNKKIKWLRLLEADEVTDEIIRDSCLDEEAFIREKHLDELLNEDPFNMNQELQTAIMSFLRK